ncbi:MAG: R3H domain-containing nucleic acid-binding protein [Bryobacteraceae bacterium]|nr:R3H domain-containing nucleic acid-binding protein [Bryobacteraceae bacterium]
MEETIYSVASTGTRIDAFLQTVVDRGRFKLTWEIVSGDGLHEGFENPDVLVRFGGHDVEILLANKAEVLLALEQLTTEALRIPAEHHSRICFDANDYRLMRIEELRLSALTAAEKVKQTRVPFRFSPMNSRERRILHLALRNEKAVRSESAGLGPQRQVIIYPADMPTPAHVPSPPPPHRGGGPGGGGRARRRSA